MFRDMWTGKLQGESDKLVKFFEENGGKGLNKTYLLACLTYVDDEKFKPMPGSDSNSSPILKEGKLQYLNLWIPPKLFFSGAKVDRNEVPQFIEYMERLFPNSTERDFFLWYLAHVVRRPDLKIFATPVLRSDPGVGKDFLVDILMAGIIGEYSAGWCLTKDILGTFNDPIQGKIVLLINELDSLTKKEMQEVKSVTVGKRIPLRRKGVPTIEIDNFCNFIFASNQADAIRPEPMDRRFWIPEYIRHKESIDETHNFIAKELKPWLMHGGLQLVRDYLETIDLAQHWPTAPAPMTPSKMELMGLDEQNEEGSTTAKTCSINDFVTIYISDKHVVRVYDIQEALNVRLGAELSDVKTSKLLLQSKCIRRSTDIGRIFITPYGQSIGLNEDTPPKKLKEYLKVK